VGSFLEPAALSQAVAGGLELAVGKGWSLRGITAKTLRPLTKFLSRSNREAVTLAKRAIEFMNRLDLEKPAETLIPAITRRYQLSELGFSCNHSVETIMSVLSYNTGRLLLDAH